MATSATTSPFPTSSVSPATPAPAAEAVKDLANKADAAVDKGAAAGQEMLNKVVQSAHSAIDRMAESAAPAVQRLHDGVQHASDTLSQRAHDAKDMGEEWAESLRSTVRDNPLTAIATALAVGVLIARLTR